MVNGDLLEGMRSRLFLGDGRQDAVHHFASDILPSSQVDAETLERPDDPPRETPGPEKEREEREGDPAP